MENIYANRVSQIQELTAGCEWRHVASANNPADLISRGTNPETLKNCRLWWVGLEWLSLHQEQWLNTPLLRHPEPLPEQRKVTTVKVVSQCSPAEFITRFSMLSRLQTVAAYCFRFFTMQETRRSEGQVILPAQNYEMHCMPALR